NLLIDRRLKKLLGGSDNIIFGIDIRTSIINGVDGHSRTKPIAPVVHRCEIHADNGIFVGRSDGLIHKVDAFATRGAEDNYIVINMSWIGGQGIGRNDRLSDRLPSPQII